MNRNDKYYKRKPGRPVSSPANPRIAPKRKPGTPKMHMTNTSRRQTSNTPLVEAGASEGIDDLMETGAEYSARRLNPFKRKRRAKTIACAKIGVYNINSPSVCHRGLSKSPNSARQTCIKPTFYDRITSSRAPTDHDLTSWRLPSQATRKFGVSMTDINNELIEFINDGKNPLWYRYALRLLIDDSEASSARVADSTLLEMHKIHPNFGDPLIADDLPGTDRTSNELQITSIRGVQNVNALTPSAPLNFSPTGLTLIFGANGSGKSGYARILRSAATVVKNLNESEVMKNVFDDQEQTQSAQIQFKCGNQDRIWNLGDGPDDDLSRSRFYDRNCGNIYVAKESEVSYQPLEINLLIRLAQVSDEMRNLIADEIEREKNRITPLADVPPETKASSFLDSMSADTDITALDREPLRFNQSKRDELSKLRIEQAQLANSDPRKEKSRLLKEAKELKEIAGLLSKVENCCSQDFLSSLKNSIRSVNAAEEAVRASASAGFSAEQLPGVGSESWKLLWSAAERYATQELHYSNQGIPCGVDDLCVLCQQPLGPNARERLQRFHQFVINDTSKELERAKKRLAAFDYELKTAISSIDTLEARLTGETISQWIGDELGKEIAAEVLNLKDTVGRNSAIMARKHDNFELFSETLCSQLIQEISEKKEREGESLTTVDFEAKCHLVQKDIDELTGLEILDRSRKTIQQSLETKKEIANLQRLYDQTSSQSITRKKTALLQKVAKSQIQKRFQQLVEKLQVVPYVDMQKGRGSKGSGYTHRPHLVGAHSKASVDNVLSEGEQMSLGIAGFLTEALYDANSSTLIFDDPVTSMDAGRRLNVARLLYEIAENRQVIVFTHDMALVADFMRIEADMKQDRISTRMIQRRGDKPGIVLEKFDWQLKDVKPRLSELKQRVANIERDFPELDESEYLSKVQDFAGLLSSLWERALVEYMAFPVFDISKLEVRPTMARIYPRFTEEDSCDFNSGYRFGSTYSTRHDKAVAYSLPTPSLEDLRTELDRLSDWVDRVRKYSN